MKIRTLNLVATEVEPKRFPKSAMPEIAVSGRSNVGKSSLLNSLLSRKNLARVSNQPGKTRTVNFFLLNDSFYLVDLPGYGFAKVSRKMRDDWKKLIEAYVSERENLAGVIQLVDSRHPPMKGDLVMIQRLVDEERDFLVVFTKSDKISRNARGKVLRDFSACFDGFTVGSPSGKGPDGKPFEVQVVFSSAQTGEGRTEIWKWIAEKIGK
ncbi:MAG TPA: ribosome biogenesis GTP-binding protein YihA/YsxC [Candidatus Krumholzibacterium sp.]|nr:ribosome biogenesis GTP-binding protein YihA/YsxC [Candidatus Krumholzibacterium sp.]